MLITLGVSVGRTLTSLTLASLVPFPSYSTHFLPPTAATLYQVSLHLLTTSNQMPLHSQSIPRPSLTKPKNTQENKCKGNIFGYF